MSDDPAAATSRATLPPAIAISVPPSRISAAAVAETIEQWWKDHFHGSPVAAHTEAYNHAFAAKDELKRRLAALL